MTFRCSNGSCYPDTTCALGHLERSTCEHWRTTPKDADPSTPSAAAASNDVPWNSHALGTADLSILSGRGTPLVIGLVGPSDSGKTSLLAFIYMWLLKHGRLGTWSFAGSWTLGAWESIIYHSRWTGVQPPTFPPHTSSSGRHPGLLHLALRNDVGGVVRDVMFTDAPGEWFTQWSRVPNDPSVSGTRWVMEHADILFLLIDSGALANAALLPNTRRSTRDLIERVGSTTPARPVFAVWTKDDILVPAAAREAVTQAIAIHLPNARNRKTTINKPETIECCFIDALSLTFGSRIEVGAAEQRQSRDPFLAFRGIHVAP